jgi:hypothetical protein
MPCSNHSLIRFEYTVRIHQEPGVEQVLCTEVFDAAAHEVTLAFAAVDFCGDGVPEQCDHLRMLLVGGLLIICAIRE